MDDRHGRKLAEILVHFWADRFTDSINAIIGLRLDEHAADSRNLRHFFLLVFPSDQGKTLVAPYRCRLAWSTGSGTSLLVAQLR